MLSGGHAYVCESPFESSIEWPVVGLDAVSADDVEGRVPVKVLSV